MFIPSKNNIGLKNYAPAGLQLKIEVPAGTEFIDISFEQKFAISGPSMGKDITINNSNNLKPIRASFNINEPIKWDFKSAFAKTINDKQEQTLNNSIDAYYQNNAWHITKKIDAEPCEQKIIYVSLLGQDYSYMLKNINVSFIKHKNFNHKKCNYFYIKDDKKSGCSTLNNNNFLLIFTILLLMIYSKKLNLII